MRLKLYPYLCTINKKTNMKNTKVDYFRSKASLILAVKKEQVNGCVIKHLDNFDSIRFVLFSNNNQYIGSTKNKFFFTYCNHYNGNSGTNMEICELTHPHVDYEDRGYLKGVATDLDGYMKLISANDIVDNIDSSLSLYMPHFRNSTHSEKYIVECKTIAQGTILEFEEFIKKKTKILNEKLRELTGCSLLYYIRRF